MPLEIHCLGQFLTKFSLLVWPQMSHAKKTNQTKKKGSRDVSCMALVKRSCKMEKESNTILVARILFGDLFPQSLLEKEKGIVSYRTASVERGQYRK